MKRKDIILIIAITVVAGIFSLITSNLLLASPKNRQTQVEVVRKLTTDFTKPDEGYFNPNAINPTRVIDIGDSSNTQPFKASD